EPITPIFECPDCDLAVSVDPHRALVELQHPDLRSVREAFSFIGEVRDGPMLGGIPTQFGRGPATFVESRTFDVRDAIHYLGVLSLTISLSLVAVSGFRW